MEAPAVYRRSRAAPWREGMQQGKASILGSRVTGDADGGLGGLPGRRPASLVPTPPEDGVHHPRGTMRPLLKRAAVAALLLMLACRSDQVSHVVQVVIPADIPTVDAGRLRAQLWAYDPGLADAPATLIDTHAVPFSHRAGATESVRMRVAGEIPAGMKAYLTVRGSEAAVGGERYILWDGQQQTGMPRLVTMQWVTNAP